ncbi:MAG: sensor histidine kinase [Actinomycetaceae bacterium]|nr:sensor histidine kinase [Actinomycetaceae bacterium]
MRIRKKKDYAAELAEVTASRREIVAAFEIERRRIERDLHDGAQQFLVASGMAIGEAQLLLGALPEDVREDLAQVLDRALHANERALSALRQTVNGIHPKVLSDLGLEYAVRDLADRFSTNVRVVVPHPLPALPEGVAAAAYFCVTEALTNAAKYAPEATVNVLIAADQDLHISVVDTGPGGAVVKEGHGLAGLTERLQAFGGKLSCHSPAGGPTTISARIPLLLFQGESGIGVEGNR